MAFDCERFRQYLELKYTHLVASGYPKHLAAEVCERMCAGGIGLLLTQQPRERATQIALEELEQHWAQQADDLLVERLKGRMPQEAP